MKEEGKRLDHDAYIRLLLDMTSRPALGECALHVLGGQVAWGKNALLCLCIAREQSSEELAEKAPHGMRVSSGDTCFSVT